MQRMRAPYGFNSGLFIPQRFMGILKSLIIIVKTPFNSSEGSAFTDLKEFSAHSHIQYEK